MGGHVIMAIKFWLKFHVDFFNQREIKKLRRLAGGDTLTIIYLKLQLISIKTEGYLHYEGTEDTFTDQIALEIDEDVENVKLTLSFLENNKLLEVVNDEYFLPKASECIGSESESAERVRRHRERKALQCNDLVTIGNGLVTTCNTDIDIELEEKESKNAHVRTHTHDGLFKSQSWLGTEPEEIARAKNCFRYWFAWYEPSRRGNEKSVKTEWEKQCSEWGINVFIDRFELAFDLYTQSKEVSDGVIMSAIRFVCEWSNWYEQAVDMEHNLKTGEFWEQMRGKYHAKAGITSV